MRPATLTQLLLLLWIAAAIGWDVFAYYRWGDAATVSVAIQTWARRWPLLLVALGMLLWHLFGTGK
jgi:hypothetical protein